MAGDFELDAEQIHRRRSDEQARHGGRRDDLGERALADERVVARRAARLAIDAEAGRGVALRVEIDDEHAFADRGERGAEIDRRRRLADPALLVGENQDARRWASAGFWPEDSGGGRGVVGHERAFEALRTRRIAASGSSLLATMSIAKSCAAGSGLELRFGRASARKDADRALGDPHFGEFEEAGQGGESARGDGVHRRKALGIDAIRSGRREFRAGAPVARATSRRNAHLRRSLSRQWTRAPATSAS